MQASAYQSIGQRKSAPASYPDGRFEGRGIVICAGGERYFTCAWVLISILRKVFRTALPIQVWHLGRREMSDEMRLLLNEEAVEVVDAETVTSRYPARLAGGWPLKPYAIAHSRFREVLYLDADTVPLTDPEVAFGWDAYRQNGLLLWPDNLDIRKTNPVWARLNLSPIDQISIDSGIMLVDKARVWSVLDLAVLMNEHCDEIYDVLYGDKGTFLIAALLFEQPYGLLPHRPFAYEGDLVQRDADGEPFLHHRTASKWLLNHPNRPLAVPTLMQSCEAALADLRHRWSGNVFHAPERSLQARAEEARIISVRNFHVENSAGSVRNIELLTASRVSANGGPEQHCAVIDDEDELILQFYRDHETVASFAKVSATLWHGVSRYPRMEIRLREQTADPVISVAADNRLTRSAEELVIALSHPAFFAAGYDAKRAAALECAFSLLNEVYDDVPEQIRKHAASQTLSPQWQEFLVEFTAKVSTERDQRIARLRRQNAVGT